MGINKHTFEHIGPGDIVKVFTAFVPLGYSLDAWQKYMQTFGEPHWKQPMMDVKGIHDVPYVVTIECGNMHSSMMQVMDPVGQLCWLPAADFRVIRANK